MHVGRWLRQRREQRGLSAEEAWARAIAAGLPREMLGTPSTLRRQEARDDVNPLTAYVLAVEVYGVSPKRMPKVLREESERLRHLLEPHTFRASA